MAHTTLNQRSLLNSSLDVFLDHFFTKLLLSTNLRHVLGQEFSLIFSGILFPSHHCPDEIDNLVKTDKTAKRLPKGMIVKFGIRIDQIKRNVLA